MGKRLANWPMDQIQTIFGNFLLLEQSYIHSYVYYYAWFPAIKAELSSCDRDNMSHKASNIIWPFTKVCPELQ